MRRFVIGDIHGCSRALAAILDEISPDLDDLLIFLGDFVDRGPDSRGVIEMMLGLNRHTRVVPLLGNHEIMLLSVLGNPAATDHWLRSGGDATLASYRGDIAQIPESHRHFFRSLRPYFETPHEIFIHAGYHPQLPLDQTDDTIRFWNHPLIWPAPHFSGKRAYLGHTPQMDGKVLDIGHIVFLDTYCFGGGWLTAMNLDTFDLVQASMHGKVQRAPWKAMVHWFQQTLRLPRGKRDFDPFSYVGDDEPTYPSGPPPQQDPNA
jgi:serine/threonine protein phosphatase 1